jgi:hypothetical protein
MSTSLIAFGLGTTAAGVAASWIARARNRELCPTCKEPLDTHGVCKECGTVWSAKGKTQRKAAR